MPITGSASTEQTIELSAVARLARSCKERGGSSSDISAVGAASSSVGSSFLSSDNMISISSR